jgi:hypothetical protein
VCGVEKNCQPLPGLEPPIIQSVSQRYTAELSQLLYKQVPLSNVFVKIFHSRVHRTVHQMGDISSCMRRTWNELMSEKCVLRRLFGPKRERTEAGKDCTMRSFVIYTIHQISSWKSNQ